MADYSLIPVDHQPDFSDVSLVPVDYDPFTADDIIQQARAQLASQPEGPLTSATYQGKQFGIPFRSEAIADFCRRYDQAANA